MCNNMFTFPFKPIIIELKKHNDKAMAKSNSYLSIAVESPHAVSRIYRLPVMMDRQNLEYSYTIAERIVKTMLWVYGGNKIYLDGNNYISERLIKEYSKGGKRAFDVSFMSRVYEGDFSVECCDERSFPIHKTEVKKGGNNNDGCRIGIDVGGSDIKVCAMQNGRIVYGKEIIWSPFSHKNPQYHKKEIANALSLAAKNLPKVDGIGVSTAGVCINGRVMISSLFKGIDVGVYGGVENIYLDVTKGYNCPVCVANDGDVAALAKWNRHGVLGIAMGTSQAGGYVSADGSLNGNINELAFVPVDMYELAPIDEWSGDIGCGAKYFSQDAVIRLAKERGIPLDDGLPQSEKLEILQKMAGDGDDRICSIFCEIGGFLGFSAPYYAQFYEISKLFIMGRVTSGVGGDIIVKTARKIIIENFPEYSYMEISLPDGKERRLAQAYAAATLPEIKRW